MFLNKILTHTCRQIGSQSVVASRLISTEEINKVEKTLNQVTLLGRVGAEPQKRGNNEHPVVVFSLATHANYKYDGGDLMQKTDWHRVCVFRPNLRESVYNFMKKGQRVLVNGRLSYGELKGEDGSVRTATSIIADDVIFFQTQNRGQQ